MNGPIKLAAPTRRILLVGGASSVLLAACSDLIGPTNGSAQFYVLAPELRAIADGTKVSWGLTVARPETSEVLRTQRIALRRGSSMDYYADSLWTDAVPQLLETLLVEAFDTSGRIKAVGRDFQGIRADYVLESDLRNFEARYDDDNGAPTVVVDIMCKLLATRTREVLSVHDAHQETRATANSVAAVVAAFNASTSGVLEDIVTWTLGAARAA